MKIKNIYQGLFLLCLSLLVGCNDFLEPKPDNRLTEEQVLENPILAEGWLLKAYKGLPNNYNFNTDASSDDAELNNPNAASRRMNSGGWAANDNPFGIWSKAYEMNLYLNTFISYVDDIEWSWTSEDRDQYYRTRLKAEAHALRAWYGFQLLQAHAGKANSGELLGFPIVTSVLTAEDDINIQRSTFAECVDYIIQDCDAALAGLPDKWEDTGDADYNHVFGLRNENRINGLAIKILKSRLALYAASPAYDDAAAATWQIAADYALEAVQANGGMVLDPSDITYYLDFNSAEVAWGASKRNNANNWEADNFPPSLYGEGLTNPTQDFVEAFPMADGLPIGHPASTFDPSNPYANRDPRLSTYVIYNGMDFKGSIIRTYVNGGADGIGASNNIATVSGYYLKKFMDENVVLDPTNNVGTEHYYTYARMTEAYLNLAEAANELGGPDQSIGGFTPRQIINDLRARAGITNTTYIDGVTTRAEMRDVIHNERRIELSFEGHRFWDIRRWEELDEITTDVKGMRISADQSTYEIFDLAERNYKTYQVYGPIPFNEILKYDIQQNAGW
ncbi:RagB/SusD family nutrient uptake outer membrane protein [Reichenbachiella ulvae]|uniref:RagB/SusD family nutrient uptake outer membrane protein n=1 Tax=Reichenbachiella ulvae TaxID=2980104 RepID=A0ABT3CZZ5_9BACT|nr:RagB/SusD family nutrient uptake outer membrane protein [Reichenbachiella ulvae]MCV9389271.1 RagB/SusD family nutrient uptake outer membrane protein [Reichenbachiella ulvae]